MKAAMFYGPNQPLKIEDAPTPDIGPGEVLVKVAACGICHTDLHYIDHGVPTFKKPPMILGHEPSGFIAGIASDVKTLKEGDRVLLPAVYACGTCAFCRSGRENICNTMVMFGNNVDGAYAEYVKAPAKDVFILPPEIPLEEGAIIADAVSTPYHAVKNRAEVRPGDTVVVYGCGGVGVNVVQVAAACGATVIAVDVSDAKLAWAQKLGATYCLNAGKEENIAKTIRKMTDGGADIAIEAIGNPKTMEAAFNTLRKGGRLVVVGYTNEAVSLAAAKIMYFEMDVRGSLGCRPVDYPRIIEMVRIGKLKVKELVTHRFPLDEIEKAFDLLRTHDETALRSIVLP